MRRERCDTAIQCIAECPAQFRGQGIVLCGSDQQMSDAWVSIRMFRHLGCELPIEIWCYTPSSIRDRERWNPLLEAHGARLQFASEYVAGPGIECLHLPLLAVLHSQFEDVLYINSAFPVQNVTAFMRCPEFLESGAIFWAGSGSVTPENPIWELLDMEPSVGRFDVGEFLVSKTKSWEPLSFAAWLANEGLESESDPTFREEVRWNSCFLSWKKFGAAYHLPKAHPILLRLPGVKSCHPHAVVQHDFFGDPLFQRRLDSTECVIPGLLLEATRRSFLRELRMARIGTIALSDDSTIAIVEQTKHLLESSWLLHGWPRFSDGRDLPSVSQDRDTNDRSVDSGNGMRNTSRLTVSMGYERELHFCVDGTFGRWSDTSLTSWNLQMEDHEIILNLRSSTGPVARLVLAADGTWAGTAARGVHAKRQIKLRRLEQAIHQKQHFSNVVLTVANSSCRLGDHVVSLYACVGAANQGMPVRFSTPFYRWFEHVVHPLIEVVDESNALSYKGADHQDIIDLNYFCGIETRLGTSQARVYSSLLGDRIVPGKPNHVRPTPSLRRFEFGNYVVIFPIDAAKALLWPDVHWQRLVFLMSEAGFEVIGAATGKDSERMREIFEPVGCFWVLNEEPDWVLDAILGAAGVISTANSAAQLAGLLDVPCVALHSQLPADYLWECTNVHGLVPEMECAPCRWNIERNYTPACELGCSALATLSPERVMKAFLNLYRRDRRAK